MSELLLRRQQRRSIFFSALEEGYGRYSRVPFATVPRPFVDQTDSDSELTFKQIGLAEKFPDEWFTRQDIAADTYFYDVGRAVALSEDDYLVRSIYEVLVKPTVTIKPPDAKTAESTIQQICEELLKRGRDYRPSVLFAPIEFMTPITLGVPTFQVAGDRDSILTGSGSLDVFWSNNYTSFRDFIVLDKKRFAEWVFKSDSGNRLVTEISPLDTTSHKVVATTIVNYHILDDNAAVRVAVG